MPIKLIASDSGQSLREISVETGISLHTLRHRYEVEDQGDRLRRPVSIAKKVFEDMSIRELSQNFGIPIKIIKSRWDQCIRSKDLIYNGDARKIPSKRKHVLQNDLENAPS